MNIKKSFKEKTLKIILSLVLIFSSASALTMNVDAEVNEDVFLWNFPQQANLVKNPKLDYGKEGGIFVIPNWKIRVSDTWNESGLSLVTGGLSSGTNGSTEAAIPNSLKKFTAHIRATDRQDLNFFMSTVGTGSPNYAGYTQLTQNGIKLNPNKNYYIVLDTVASSKHFNDPLDLQVFAQIGNDVKTGKLITSKQHISVGFKRTIVIVEIQKELLAGYDGEISLSLRENSIGGRSDFNIFNVGIFLEEDIHLLSAVDKLFYDRDHTMLKGTEVQDIRTRIASAKALAEQTLEYSEGVVSYALNEISKAQELLDQILTLDREIDSHYVSVEDKVVKDTTTAEEIAALKAKVAEVKSPGFKDTLNSRVNELEKLFNLLALKGDLKAEIDRYSEQLFTEITSFPNANDSDKDVASKKLTDTIVDVKYNIDKAQSEGDTKASKTSGIGRIDAVMVELRMRDGLRLYKNGITRKANETKTSIQDFDHLSNENKIAAQNLVDAAKLEGHQKIDASTTVEAGVQIEKDTLLKFEEILNNARFDNAKAAGVFTINEKANKTNLEIDNLPAGSTINKESAKKDIEIILKDTVAQIEAAQNQKDIDDAVSAGSQKMDDIFKVIAGESEQEIEKDKELKRTGIEQEAAAAKQAIAELQNITPEDKKVKNEAIDRIADETFKAIHEANTLPGIETAHNKGVQSLQAYVAESKLEDVKLGAIKELNAEKEATNNKIDALHSLSAEERQQAATKIQNILVEATEAITNFNQEKDITAKVLITKEALNATYEEYKKISDENFAKVKNDAKAMIDESAQNVETLINTLSHLSDDQKTKAIETLKNLTDSGKNTVEMSATPEAVVQNVQKAMTSLESFKELTKLNDYREQAYKEIDDKAQESNRVIDQLEGVDASEKAKATEEINQVKTNAREVIQNASDKQSVEKALSDAKKMMDLTVSSIVNLSQQNMKALKDGALAEIRNKVNEAINTIDGFSSLSQALKDKATETLNGLFKKFEERIELASTKQNIVDAKDDAIFEIKDILVDTELKDYQAQAVSKLDEKAVEIKSLIDALPGVDQTAKDEAKAQVDQANVDAKNLVVNATDKHGVDEAVSQGISAMSTIYGTLEIESDTTVETSKNEAKASIQKAVEEAVSQVRNMKFIANQEKEAAIESIENKGLEIQAQIDASQTLDDIQSVVVAGNKELNELVAKARLEDRKIEANNQLKDVAATVLNKINQLPALTPENRQSAIDDIDLILRDSQSQIDALQNIDAISEAVDQATIRLNALFDKYTETNNTAIQEQKDKAKEVADQKGEEAKKEIDALPDLSLEDKEKAKEAVDKITEEKKKDIDAATTPREIQDKETELDQAITDITDQAILDDHKAKANKDLDAKANEVKEAIDALAGVDQTAKDEAKAKVDQANADAKTVVGQAIDEAMINQAVSSGKNAMDAIYDALEIESETTIVESKEKAKGSIQAEVEAAKQRVEELQLLSDEAKATSIQEIEMTGQEIQTNIDAVDTLQEIQNIKTQGILKLQDIVEKAEFENRKLVGSNTLTGEAARVLETIKEKPSLKPNQILDAIQDVDTTRLTVIEHLMTSQTEDELKASIQTGIDTLNALISKYQAIDESELDKDNTSAKLELTEYAKQAKAEIAELKNLGDDNKSQAYQNIDQSVEKAHTDIDTATNPRDTQKIVNDTKTVIDAVVSKAKLNAIQNAAIQSLNESKEAITHSINMLPGVKQDQKQSALDDIAAVVQTAQTQILQAQDQSTIDILLKSAQDDMQTIFASLEKESEEHIEEVKDLAKGNIQEELDKAKAQVDALSYLDENSKISFKNDMDQVAMTVSNKLETVNTLMEIDSLKIEGIEAIQTILNKAVFADKKIDAQQQIENYANSVFNRIEAQEALSQQHIEQARNDINVAKNTIFVNLDHSLDALELSENILDGKAQLDQIASKYQDLNTDEMTKNKDKAKEEADQKGEEAKKEIDALPDLSLEDKEKAKEAVDKITEEKKKDIDDATTPKEIQDKETELDQAITDITDQAILDDHKAKANKDLDAKANEVKEAIDALAGVDQTAKDEAKAKVDQANADAKTAVGQASDADAVDAAVQAGKDAMDKIAVETQNDSDTAIQEQKDKAKEAADQKGEEAKKEIDALPDLTPDEKEKAKEAVDKITEEKKKDIDDATTPKEIQDKETELDQAITDITDQAILDDHKAKANKDLDAKANEVKEAIDALAGVDQTAKDEAKAKVDQANADAKTAVGQASDADGVDAAVQAGKDAMDKIAVETQNDSDTAIQEQKDKAKEAADQKGEEAKKDIDDLPDLSPEDKEKAKDAVDKITEDAKKDIDDATTPKDIENIQKETDKEIDTIREQAKLDNAKAQAVKALNRKALELKNMIDKLNGVNQKAKDRAKAQIDQVNTDAQTKVMEAQSINTVESVVKAAINDMENIAQTIQNDNDKVISEQKEEAKKDADQKGEEAKKDIDALPNLTPDEKEKAKEAIDKTIDEAKKAIDSATTPAEIEGITNDSQANIDGIVDNAKLQDSKNQAVNALSELNKKLKQEVEEMTGITREQKDQAIQEINTILEKGMISIRQAQSLEDVNTEQALAQAKANAVVTALRNSDKPSLPATGVASKAIPFVGSMIALLGSVLVFIKKKNEKEIDA